RLRTAIAGARRRCRSAARNEIVRSGGKRLWVLSREKQQEAGRDSRRRVLSFQVSSRSEDRNSSSGTAAGGIFRRPDSAAPTIQGQTANHQSSHQPTG